MEEARRVLDRLRRIELLERERAGAPALLAEVRELLREAEVWARAEGDDLPCAAAAIERCDTALAEGRVFVG